MAGGGRAYIQVLPLLLIYCVTLGKLFNSPRLNIFTCELEIILVKSRPGTELMEKACCFCCRNLIFFSTHELIYLCGQTKLRTQALKVDSWLLKSLLSKIGSNRIVCLSPSPLSLSRSLTQAVRLRGTIEEAPDEVLVGRKAEKGS